jgi:hypothetical protein
VTAQALRALLTGGEWQSPLLQAVAWSIGIGVVFAALAVRRYRRT